MFQLAEHAHLFQYLKILCSAFSIGEEGLHVSCEKADRAGLCTQQEGKSVITIIDEAHLLDIEVLRKLRLMFEEFPKPQPDSFQQTELLSKMSLKVKRISNRVLPILQSCSSWFPMISKHSFSQLDKCGLGHNVFTEDAIALITRSSDGILRRIRNLALSTMLEAVRARTKSIGIEIVNKVLIQPHWRNEYDMFTENKAVEVK